MAVVPLTDHRACGDFWQQRVLNNLSYWQEFLGRHRDEVDSLDREWETMVRGIALGLKSVVSWPQSYQLITALAGFMERRGYWEAWRAILEEALAVARQAEEADCEVTLLALSARLWQRQGQPKPMVAAYLRAIRLGRRLGLRFEEARACTNLGYYFVERGRWHRAEVLCRHALCLFKEIDSHHGRAHTENHLGILYIRQGRWAEAERCLTRACEIWETMSDQHGLMRGHINLCLLYLGTKQPDKILPCAEKALAHALVTKDELEIGRIYLNMGAAYFLKKNLVEAEAHIQRAAGIFHRYSECYGLASVSRHLGVIHLAQKNWSEAFVHLKRALDDFRNLQLRSDEIQTIVHFVEYELARGNQPQAEKWFKEAETLLRQHPSSNHYYQLSHQLHQIRRSLNRET